MGYSKRERQRPYSVFSISELDSFPIATHRERLVVPIDMMSKSSGSSLVFEFYSDEKGSVRIPSLAKIVGQIPEELLFSAQSTLGQWKFEAPRANGKKVVAKAAQRFTFD